MTDLLAFEPGKIEVGQQVDNPAPRIRGRSHAGGGGGVLHVVRGAGWCGDQGAAPPFARLTGLGAGIRAVGGDVGGQGAD